MFPFLISLQHFPHPKVLAHSDVSMSLLSATDWTRCCWHLYKIWVKQRKASRWNIVESLMGYRSSQETIAKQLIFSSTELTFRNGNCQSLHPASRQLAAGQEMTERCLLMAVSDHDPIHLKGHQQPDIQKREGYTGASLWLLVCLSLLVFRRQDIKCC